MTEQEKFSYEGVQMGYGDVIVAFGFYVNACNSFGYAQPIESIAEITEENLIDVVMLALEAGFTLQASGQFRKFEQHLLEKDVNNGLPKVWTSFYGNFANLDKYGVVPIRVARMAPRFNRKHDAYLQLAPTKEMLAEAKSGDYDHKDWRRRFDLILAELDPHKVYKELLEIGVNRDVAILCYEKPDERCHRKYVLDWFKAAGYEIAEFPTKEFYDKPDTDTCCQAKLELDETDLKDE